MDDCALTPLRASANPPPSVSFYLNVQGEFTYVDDSFMALTGYPAAALLTRTLAHLLVPTAQVATAPVLQRALRGEVLTFEVRLLNTLGQYQPVVLMTFPLLEQHVVVGIGVVVRPAPTEEQPEADDRERAQPLSVIFRSMREVVFVLAVEPGLHYRFAFINQAFLDVTGLPLAAVRGRLVQEVIPEPSLGLVLAEYQQAVDTRQRRAWLETTEYPTGQRIGEVSVTPVFTDAGTCTHLVGTVHDLTAQKQVEEALQAADQRQVQERAEFAQIFAHTPAAICINRGPEHRYEYVNAAYQQFFPDRQLLGRTVAEALPETVDAGLVDLLDAVYRTGEIYFGHELPLLLVQPEGLPPKQMYFTFTYQAYRENGEIVGISTFAYNVAEQVLARHEREAQQQQLQELFMQAPAPIVILDGPDFVYQLINPAYQRIFPGRELRGKPLFEAMPELVDTVIPGLLNHVYQTGEPVTVQELPLQMARHEGNALEEIYWTFTYQAHRDAHGTIDGVRVFAHDVSEHVRARQQQEEDNEALIESNRQLTRTNTDLDAFVYIASHDLKTPVANIEGLLAALQDELPAAVRQTGVVQPLLDRMQGAVERFQLTIAQLTDVAKLQQAQIQSAEVVDLATLVADLRLDLAPLLATTDAQLTLDVAACPQVSFAPQHLRSIVYNLLGNAVKYRHPDRPPVVQVRCRSTATFVVLEVQDNGLGLTPAQQAKLFGLFQRQHDHVEGAGLGLYMVKRLVENAGGHIGVQSQAGVGSTFTVTLPRADEGVEK